MSKRLYRKENNRVLGGVCSGLGEYIGIDPLFLRIFFVLWTIMGELSVLAYLIRVGGHPARGQHGGFPLGRVWESASAN
jgi:Putative stress-responsive transcriptional regulator